MMIETEIKKMNYEDFEPLFGSWAQRFRPFIESEDFYNIYQRVKTDAERERVFPSFENVFKVFQLTKFEDIKVVIYLGDPYPRVYKDGTPQATGIPMSCDNTPDGHLQPSLENFYSAMGKELQCSIRRSKSLDYLLEQGVLLMNSDLTVKKNKTGSHEGVWLPFQKYFLEQIMYGTTGIVYVLLGDASRAIEGFINPLGNYILGGKKNKIDHPAAVAYGPSGAEWDSKGIFKKINKILKDNNKDEVFWNKDLWESIKELPF